MSDSQSDAHALDRVVVRFYDPGDQGAVEHLYRDGLLVGQVDPGDTGADIRDITGAYRSDGRSQFWVAQVDGDVVGMIGVAVAEEHTAEIRRLRVDKAWQGSGIAAALLETALAHCRHHQFLKVRLDTRFDPTVARGLFDRFGFQHTKTTAVAGRELLEFYLDLYRTQE